VGQGLLNQARMSTIESGWRPDKKAENHLSLTWKIPMKIFLHYPPTLLSHSKILKDFSKTCPTKMKPRKCPAKEKNGARKAKE